MPVNVTTVGESCEGMNVEIALKFVGMGPGLCGIMTGVSVGVGWG